MKQSTPRWFGHARYIGNRILRMELSEEEEVYGCGEGWHATGVTEKVAENRGNRNG